VVSEALSQSKLVKLISEVVEEALSNQPITRREFTKYVEDGLRKRLGDGYSIDYLFDHIPFWRELLTVNLDDNAYVSIWRTKENDVIDIADKSGSVKTYVIRIEGKLIEVCRDMCEYVMVNCVFKGVREVVSDE
jgi:hypothetical protein